MSHPSGFDPWCCIGAKGGRCRVLTAALYSRTEQTLTGTPLVGAWYRSVLLGGLGGQVFPIDEIFAASVHLQTCAGGDNQCAVAIQHAAVGVSNKDRF